MPNQIRGRVLFVKPTESIQTKTPGKIFTKREIVIDATRYDPYTGVRGMENTPCITFTGDRCALLDNIPVGMIVCVDFDVFGRKGTDPNKPDQYFNDIRGYRIEEIKPQVQAAPQPQQTASVPVAAQPAAAPGYAPAPQPGYAQPVQGQPGYAYPPQQQYQQAQAPAPAQSQPQQYSAQQGYPQMQTQQSDDLPF